MKLATVNPRMDFNIEALLSKDVSHKSVGIWEFSTIFWTILSNSFFFPSFFQIFQSRGSLPHGLHPLDTSSLPLSFPFGYQNQNHHHHHQPQQLPQLHNTIANDQTQFPLNAQAMHRTPTIQLPAVDGFPESTQQVKIQNKKNEKFNFG